MPVTCHFENGPCGGEARALPDDELPLGVRVVEAPTLPLVPADVGTVPVKDSSRVYEYRLRRIDPVLPTVGYYRL